MTAARAMSCGCQANRVSLRRVDFAVCAGAPSDVYKTYTSEGPTNSGRKRTRLFGPQPLAEDESQDHADHTGNAPARSRQEGIDRLCGEARMIVQPDLEIVQAVR